MRNTIRFLVILMIILICNIIGYLVSEDYRFFLKKIKYRNEVVYDTSLKVDDADRVSILDTSKDQVYNNNAIQTSGTGFNFLNALAGKTTKTNS